MKGAYNLIQTDNHGIETIYNQSWRDAQPKHLPTGTRHLIAHPKCQRAQNYKLFAYNHCIICN